MSAPLRRSIAIAAAARAAMASGATLEKAFAAASAKASPEERSAALSVTYSATRRAIAAGGVMRLLCDREPAPAVESLLAAAVALLIEGEEKPYTVVSEAVAAARLRRPTERAAGFVNGCLRTFCRNREEILRRVYESREARCNAPSWWIRELEKSLGAEAADRVLAVQCSKPPLALRVNRRRISRENWIRKAAAAGIEALPLGLDGVLLPKPVPVSAIPGFTEGLASVQDAGAQLAARFLAPRDGERILDACAAPGGKTAHILEIADAEVTALEKDPVREPRISENLSRLGLRARSLCRDAADTASWWDGRPFDAVLLDAPCTASGIVRRHPDIVFSRRQCDIFSLAKQQKALLDALWPCVRIGGRLLYAVCSVFREEGPMQASSFLREHPDALPGTLARGLGGSLSLAPQEAGAEAENAVIPRIHDGFFYAVFVKGAE